MTSQPSSSELAIARQVLSHWAVNAERLAPVTEGLINFTLRVETPSGAFLLQRLHPVFRAEVHLDIEAITAWIAARELPTPRLVRTQQGALWVVRDGIWRLQTGLPGRTVQRITGPAMAAEAGALLGRFHWALRDCPHEFHFVRQAHGLARHVSALGEALAAHPHHRLASEVSRLAKPLFDLAAPLPGFEDLPLRITHGDPKISNILFHPDDRAYALVDLDTLGRLDLPTELGDAFRSWCNPEGEDGGQPRFDLALFEAALSGYARTAGDLLTLAERERLVTGLLVICTELACRFAADALNERYFGWDPAQFPTRGDHNLHRARIQFHLAEAVSAARSEAEQIVSRSICT